MNGDMMKSAKAAAIAVFCTAGLAAPALAEEAGHGALQVSIPLANAEEGRRLFATKGCVICHQVNSVGGKAAMPLDAVNATGPVDLMDFVARMWRGAAAMTELQAIELGYQIELDGEEIAHLAAFAADLEQQKQFKLKDVPDPMQSWFLDQPYWEEEDWETKLRQEWPQEAP